MARTPRGAALISVLLVVVLLEGLAALAFAAGLAGHFTARSATEAAQARGAAEAGLVRALAGPLPAGWDTAAGAVPVGTSVMVGGAAVAVTLRPLSRRTLVVASHGVSARGRGEASVGELAVRRPRPIELPAALAYQGALHVLAPLVAVGTDGAPVEWAGACGASDTVVVPGQLVIADSVLWFDGLPHAEWVRFAKASWDQRSLVTPGPVSMSGICYDAVATNWGDPRIPATPCADYVPTVYHAGDLEVVGGVGQGVLVVEGDLAVGGGFTYHGLVVVRGSLVVGEGGAVVWGGVVAGRSALTAHVVRGPFQVRRSRCLVELGLPPSAGVAPLRPRRWLQLAEAR